MHIVEADELPAGQTLEDAGSRILQVYQRNIGGAVIGSLANCLQQVGLAACRITPDPAARTIGTLHELLQKRYQRIVAGWPEAFENGVVLELERQCQLAQGAVSPLVSCAPLIAASRSSGCSAR